MGYSMRGNAVQWNQDKTGIVRPDTGDIALTSKGEVCLYGADEWFDGDWLGALDTVSEVFALTSLGKTIDWKFALFDTAGAYSAATPSRITVPAGATRININASISFSPTAGGSRWVRLTKNAAQTHMSNTSVTEAMGGLAMQSVPLNTGWIDCVEGEYFELHAIQNSGVNIALTPGTESNKGGSTYFRAQFK